jgi:hypothetical protein
MWIQTTHGTFAIARYPEDIACGMLTLQSNSFDDLFVFSRRYLNGIQPNSAKGGPFSYSLRAPESHVALAVAKLASEVWYSELPGAIETLAGPDSGSDYWAMYKGLYNLRPRQQTEGTAFKGPEKIILQIGCDGGSLSIGMKEEHGQRRYVAHLFDRTPTLLNDDDGGGPPIIEQDEFPDFVDALHCLSRYSWWQLYPLQVAPEFRGLIRAALRLRGVDTDATEWSYVLKDEADLMDQT